MKRFSANLMMCCAALILTAVAAANEAVTIKMQDGTRWRGNMQDMVLVKFDQNGVPVEMEGQLVKNADLYVR